MIGNTCRFGILGRPPRCVLVVSQSGLKIRVNSRLYVFLFQDFVRIYNVAVVTNKGADNLRIGKSILTFSHVVAGNETILKTGPSLYRNTIDRGCRPRRKSFIEKNVLIIVPSNV